MKVAIAAVLGLASLGLFGVAFAESGSLRSPVHLGDVAVVDVPAFPQGGDFKGVKADAKPADAKAPEAKAPEAKAPETRPEAKPAEVKAADQKPVAGKPAVEAKATDPKPVAAKPAEAAPAVAKPPPGAPAEKKTVAGKPEAAEAAPAAAPAATDAMLNLRASDTADVFVDGRKAGQSPALGYKVKPGKHKIRFDCYEASGATMKGPEKTIDVRALEERDVEYECTAEAKAPSHEESPY